MITANARMHEMCKMVMGLAPINPSSSTPDYVSMKGYARCCVVVLIDNGTATGGAISLHQATAVAGTAVKALPFTKMWANLDTAASDVLVETAVTANTFDGDSTNDKFLMYVMEVEAADLDLANGFDCIRAGTADATAAITSVLYILYPGKYAKVAGPVPSAIVD